MSGFTRDTRWYGDRLVYEALLSKWGRYHDRHCGCAEDWVASHALPAGFEVVRVGSGFIALTGPGLTEDVDEQQLTTNALWEALTGTPGAGWAETITVVDRGEAAERDRRAANAAHYAPRKARTAAAKVEPATEAQLRYLRSLAAKVGPDRFAEEFDAAIKRTAIAAREPAERPETMIQRLTKATARTLITTLAE